MDKRGAGFSSILGVFLIISLPLLLYRSSTSDSVWSYRKVNQTFPEGKLVPEIAVVPTPTGGLVSRFLVKSCDVGRVDL